MTPTIVDRIWAKTDSSDRKTDIIDRYCSPNQLLPPAVKLIHRPSNRVIPTPIGQFGAITDNSDQTLVLVVRVNPTCCEVNSSGVIIAWLPSLANLGENRQLRPKKSMISISAGRPIESFDLFFESGHFPRIFVHLKMDNQR